jgi:hypothetical protein
LRDYIVNRFAEDKSEQLVISDTTVARLFNAPNKTYKSAMYYKGIFDIKKCGGNTISFLIKYNSI